MWKYQQADFALLLLGELQKQQQGSIFCDTLLQTEGVCIPAHSCVLAALSPIFSRVLSTSPAPPAGKNRLVSLEAVGSHALLKLVGFLYTGEMEIESQSEHEDVMAAAHKLGLKNLIERKRVWVERRVEDVGRCWKETGVQTEESVKGKKSVCVPLPVESQSGTFYNANNNDASVLEADLSFDKSSQARGFNWISDVTVPTLTDVKEASASNHRKTKAKSRWKLREGHLKNPTLQQNQMKLPKLNQPGGMEKSGNVSGKDFRKLLEAVSLPKNASNEETKLDKLKVKIKLRRRGTCWESNLLVSVQGESDEVKNCGPPTPGCLSSVLSGQSLGTLTPPTDLPISPSDCSKHMFSDKLCPHTPNHNSLSSLLGLPTLSSSPPQAEESDEQIAMLLEEMFMMGLNILPLMPLDRNLDEHQMNQPDPLQEEEGGEETSADGSGFNVQGCEKEIRESGILVLTPVKSPQQRYEEVEHSSSHNQSKPETVKPSAQSAGTKLQALPSNMNQDTNLETTTQDSVAPHLEDFLTTSDCPLSEPGELSDSDITTVFKDKLDFKLVRCLSPLESEKPDSDVPTQEPSLDPSPNLSETHKQYPEAQNLPLWLSESPVNLDLHSMNDSSRPLQLDGSQNQSSPCLAKKQVFKTSLAHHVVINKSGSCVDKVDAVGEPSKWRMTRRRLYDGSQAQSRLSKTKCDNNSHGVSMQKSTPFNANGKTVAGVKRKQENCLPLDKKLSLNMTSKQQEHGDLPKAQVTVQTVKRGRGRPKSKKRTAKNVKKCNEAKNWDQTHASLSTGSCSGLNECEIKKTKTDNVHEQDDKQEQSVWGKNLKETDVNSNLLTKQNVHLNYSAQAKKPSIIDQIFHQTSPSNASRCPLLIGRQQKSNLQDTSPHERSQGPLVNSGDCGKLVINNSEHIGKCICEDNEISALINDKEAVEALDNQERLQMSNSNMPDTVKCSVEEGEDAAVFQCQNEMRKNIQDQPTVNDLPSEDITSEIMKVVLDHAMSITNESTVIERIAITRIVQELHTSVYVNPEGTQENNEEDENLSRCKVVQPMNETTEGEDTEVWWKNNEDVERIDLCGSDEEGKVSTNGCEDRIDEKGDQYSSKIFDRQTLLEEVELSTVHTASARTTDDSINAALTPRGTQVLITDVGFNHSNFHSPSTENNKDHSADYHSDSEVIEVDVVEDPADSPLWPFAAGQIITMPIESLQDQEMDVTEEEEEEEIDVTGEETE